MLYSYYVKVDNNENIIDAFSSWQINKFDGTEIKVIEGFERHFNLSILDGLIYRYKWTGNKIKEKTKEEKDKEKLELPIIKTGLENLIDVLIYKNIILESDL